MSDLEPYIFDRCLTYLGIRPRSKKELKDYISKILYKHEMERDFKESLVDRILFRLEELKLVDDTYFAKLVVEQKINGKNPKGVNAIKSDLIKKGIPRDIIESVIKNPNQPPREMVQRKLAFYSKKNPKSARQNTIRFLVGRGFSIEDAINAIDTISLPD